MSGCSANRAEAADSSPGIPAIFRQCFTNWLFRNLGAFQESSSATSPTDQGRFAVTRAQSQKINERTTSTSCSCMSRGLKQLLRWGCDT